MQIHARTRTEQPLDKLLAAHFEAKNAYWKFFLDRDVFGNVHGERRFAHARPRRDHDHLGGVQSAGHAVKLDEAG